MTTKHSQSCPIYNGRECDCNYREPVASAGNALSEFQMRAALNAFYRHDGEFTDCLKAAIAAALASQSTPVAPVVEQAPAQGYDIDPKETVAALAARVGAWETPEGFVSFGSWMALAAFHHHVLKAAARQWNQMEETRAALAHSTPHVPADPLQGAADWLKQAFEDCTVGDLQRNLRIGYNRASRLFSAAPHVPAGEPKCGYCNDAGWLPTAISDQNPQGSEKCLHCRDATHRAPEPAAPVAQEPIAQVVCVYPPGPDGPEVNWLGKAPKPGTLLYLATSSDAAEQFEFVDVQNHLLRREIQRVIKELRTYNPAADEYKGEHIHGVWARELEAVLAAPTAAQGLSDVLEALRDLEAMAERYRPQGYPIPDAQKRARAILSANRAAQETK